MQQSLNSLLRSLREDTFFLILLAGLVLLSVFAPGRIASYGSLVDWPTIAALTGLLLLTKGLEISGGLHRLGHILVGWMATERSPGNNSNLPIGLKSVLNSLNRVKGYTLPKFCR